MHRMKRRAALVGLAVLLAASVSFAAPNYAERRDGFNDEYVFAATRGVNEADMHPAFKVTLFPLTVLLDTAFLPFAVIAGFVT